VQATVTITISNADGSGRQVREAVMWMAGSDRRLLKFSSPAGVRGIALLVTGSDDISIYLPAQRLVRRIQGGAKNEDFQGTDFSYEELGSYEYTRDYKATLASEDGTTWTLSLARKAGSSKPYTKATMIVDKATMIPRSLELYDGEVKVKSMTILETKKVGAYTTPTRIRMVNVKTGHFTEIEVKEIAFDQGFDTAAIFRESFMKKSP
jgi:outer membrane lipoprotein-sorting protein